MKVTIHPSSIKGIVQAPASKSSMQRACAAALLCGRETILKNPGHSNDDKAAIRVIKGLGAQVETLADGSLKIISHGVNPDCGAVNCGESGLGIRMFAPIVAMSKKRITIDGEGSLLSRPMDFFDEVLPRLNVETRSNNGRLPLKLKGPLEPKNIEVDGSLSSQFLTGLLMAYSASGASDTTIKVKNLKSRPYIDLTLKVMADFGMKVPENRNYEYFYFPGSSVVNRQSAVVSRESSVGKYTVEGDWSGGAFLLVAGAIAGNITVRGLDPASTQADKAILQALKDAGANMQVSDKQIRIGPPVGMLKAFRFNATDCPDLFPPLVALASYCEGTSAIEGVNRLAHKESDRGLTLQEEFGKMGTAITLQGDLMLVKRGVPLQSAHVHSRHDHRIAMACAVAALKAGGNVIIDEAQAVNKSYPDFYDHLKLLGATVDLK